jgi:hypothetical protein
LFFNITSQFYSVKATQWPKERGYIEKVFKENYNQKYFMSENGSYHLFVPYENNDKKMIFSLAIGTIMEN